MYAITLACVLCLALSLKVKCKEAGKNRDRAKPKVCERVCHRRGCAFLIAASSVFCLVTTKHDAVSQKRKDNVDDYDALKKTFPSLKTVTTAHRTIRCGKTSSVDCGRPDHFIRRDYSVHYNRTNYGSIFRVQCGLGKYSAGDGQSMCGANGKWTQVSLHCEGIPNMRGTKTLDTSGASNLECRNVMSSHVTRSGLTFSTCQGNEILTGCSVRPGVTAKVQQTKGSFVKNLKCLTKSDKGPFSSVESVARCCKIPGIQCEYIRSKTNRGPVGCYKNFQLIDCSCWRQRSAAGPCPTLPTNSTCQGHPFIRAWRYATCCYHENLDCYMKTARGQKAVGSSKLTIHCRNGEIMTACSGYNIGRGMKEAIVRGTNGTDECRLDPGRGSIETLVGYISCCKMKHA